MNLNRVKSDLSKLQMAFKTDCRYSEAIDIALECITLVQNIDAVYNASDANEASIYGVQDILEAYFGRSEELCLVL